MFSQSSSALLLKPCILLVCRFSCFPYLFQPFPNFDCRSGIGTQELTPQIQGFLKKLDRLGVISPEMKEPTEGAVKRCRGLVAFTVQFGVDCGGFTDKRL